MHLLGLPGAVLQKIGGLLDAPSIVAMSSAYPQLQEKFKPLLESLQLREITESMLAYLDSNGSYVRNLDLSDCVSNYRMVKSLVLKCPSIKELNLVNSNFRTLSALAFCHGVETLSLTAVDGVYHMLPSNYQHMKKNTGFMMCCSVQPYIVREKLPFDSLASSALGSVKKIYIETVPGEQQMVFTMCFLNLCHNVEAIHINVYGRSRNEAPEDIHLPALAAHHWETVNTVVVTRHLTKRGSAKSIMKAIFAHHTTPEIRRWVNQDQECYIYEYGQFNGEVRSKFEANSDITLLKQFHQVDLSMDGVGSVVFASPWGPAQSIRITGNLFGASSFLDYSVSSTLTELDITKCHGDFTNEFRVRLLTAVPRLEVLACSLCVFALLDQTAYLGESEEREVYKQFKKVLHELRLRKVFIRGGVHGKGTCTHAHCFCPDSLHCYRCSHEEPLECSELVDLSELSHLEELTVRDVDLDASAFGNLGNSNLHTLKLCLTLNISDLGLKDLMQKSRNLKYIKLEAPELTMISRGMFMALSEAKDLRQLCLRTERITNWHRATCQDIAIYLKSMLQTLEFMHLHCYFRIFDAFDHHRYRSRCKLRHYSPAPYDEWSRQRPGSIGRGLCYAESSVGVVPPIGWDIDPNQGLH